MNHSHSTDAALLSELREMRDSTIAEWGTHGYGVDVLDRAITRLSETATINAAGALAPSRPGRDASQPEPAAAPSAPCVVAPSDEVLMKARWRVEDDPNSDGAYFARELLRCYERPLP